MKKENAKTKGNIENLSKVIEEKKKIPQKIKEQISSKRFENIIFAVVMIVYLIALNLGMANIPTENYLVDLKVFSVMLLCISIILFELAYKKDVGDLWLHAIEIMIISIFTAYLMHLYSIYYNTFGSIIFIAAAIFLIYYVIKILLMKRSIIKKYNKSLVDINEIVKK